MRVLVVDDHALVREGMAAVFSAHGVHVVGKAGSAVEAWGLVRELQPEVVVLDVALPDLLGLDLCRRIRRRFPQTAVVLISMFDDPAWRTEAALAGASAYVLKGESPAALVEAVRCAASGESLLPRPTQADLPLTDREREVVRLIAQGHKLSEIARLLSRSIPTVRAHKASAMRKLGVHCTVDLIQKALDLGLVKVPSPKEVHVGKA